MNADIVGIHVLIQCQIDYQMENALVIAVLVKHYAKVVDVIIHI